MRINNPLAVASCKRAMAAAKLRLFISVNACSASSLLQGNRHLCRWHVCTKRVLFLPLKSLWNGQSSLHFKFLSFTVTCLKWLTKDLLKHDSPLKVRLSNSVAPNCVLKLKREDKNIFFYLFAYAQTKVTLARHWMKSWIWLYLARRQMLDKSNITFVGRQKRVKLRQICHHICPRQMYNKCIINTTPYLLSDKYRVTLNKFEAENSDVLIAIYISPHWLLSVFSLVNVWVWVFRAELLCNFNREKK